jgi:chemotaxis protein methyltransferase CheR
MKEKPATVTAYELDELRALIVQRSGILFDESRERFFSTRVREYVTEKSLPSGTDLLRVVLGSNVEYDAMLERLLTQETSFFRYPAVFDALGKKILPELQERKFWDNPRTLRIWSAACSTGEEPYSIAIAVADALPFAEAWRIEILATDISRRALQHAERGVYSGRSLENLAPQQLDNYFTKTRHGYVVKPRIRRMVTFAPMNLSQAVYVGRMDCIFCMNVLMYFSDERRKSVLQRFSECLEPGGYFLLGHAETLNNSSVRFDSLVLGDCRIYRKPVKESATRQVVVAEGSL